MIFNILALISVIFIVVILKRIAGILPYIVACLSRWKENINIYTSLKLRRDRDIVAIAMIIPFCLLATNFRLIDMEFMSDFTTDARLGITAGILTGYLLLRQSVIAAMRFTKISSTTYYAATSTEHTYFIVLSILLLATGGFLSVIGVNLNAVRIAMFCLSGAIYAAFLFQKLQIFSSSCSFFMSFLYLCALEILPTGVLIASAVIF